MKYRPEIDGLRAIAVIPVIFFHAGFGLFGGGFVGVDVFFVISGYLITTIILEDVQNEKFSIIEFYERRARRILPALFVVCLTTAIASWIILNPIDLNKFGRSLIGVATFTSNILFWREQGYFDSSAELNPFIHTWSLSVEEQYYIVFPLLLLLIWKFGKNKAFWTILVLAACSFALSEWGWRNKATANFYLAPTRAWELFAGSLAAFVTQSRGVQSSNFLSSLGLAAIAVAVFTYNENTPFPSVYTLLPVTGAVLLIIFSNKETQVARLLSTKAVTGIGLISYSAYLWHQPLFSFARILSRDVEIGYTYSIIIIALNFLLAFVVWRYIERPFRVRYFISRGWLFSLSLVSLVGLALIGFMSIQASKEFENQIAYDLATSDFVYFSNMDERKFVAARLSLPLKDVETVVMGSSRVMQIGSGTLNEPILNLAVSGASIEDDIAFIAEATAKLNPRRVVIGADPWLLNRFNFLDSWRSVDRLYGHWIDILLNEGTIEPATNRYYSDDRIGSSILRERNLAKYLYKNINFFGSMIANSSRTEANAKKAYDGFHIYGEQYVSTPVSTMHNGFEGAMNYAMAEYEYDEAVEMKLSTLVKWLQKFGVEVALILTPYHPELYARITVERPVFLTIEESFRKLAKRLDVEVLGSYDPNQSGCTSQDFFDGMHPKEGCMKRVVRTIIGSQN